MRLRGVRRLELSPVVLATYNHNNHKAITPPKPLSLPLAVRDWGGLVRVCTSRATAVKCRDASGHLSTVALWPMSLILYEGCCIL
ncbi:hypothetical protein CDV31_004990 [Fusarium ambrosium]|uniref:Uncharacterized protein n=1 Tax=Fusarium ambrosium TaxID=131363 RepID=A0A428UME3_9HYPO|nr:hypothetical protein CDV31_004990 [Fusarium ambrosium]